MDLLLEITASFPGGGSRGYENGPAFVPGEICRLVRSAGEKFLHLIPKTGKGKKAALPVSKDKFISKMFL